MRASEKAYQALRLDITDGRLQPGAVLAEVELAERVGVSRTPIREALSKLLADGLVEQAEGRGFVVAPISLSKVRELFEYRQTLETSAAALAAQRGDAVLFESLARQFEDATEALEKTMHQLDLDRYYQLVTELDQAIDDSSNNRYLVAALKGLRLQIARIRKLSKTNPRRLIQAAHEHSLIAQAISQRNTELAQATTTVHLANALATIEKAIQQA